MNIKINEHNFSEIAELDKSFIGTNKYLGLAYFWNHEYRHYLRDASSKITKKVHDEFLKNGLQLYGVSETHEKIIVKALGVKV